MPPSHGAGQSSFLDRQGGGEPLLIRMKCRAGGGQGGATQKLGPETPHSMVLHARRGCRGKLLQICSPMRRFERLEHPSTVALDRIVVSTLV